MISMIKMNFLGDRNPSEARKEQKDAAIKFAAALDAIDVYSVKNFKDLVTKLKSKPDIEVHHVKPSGDKKGKILSASGIAITGLMKFLVNEQAYALKNDPLGSPDREQMYNELCKLFGVTRIKGGRVSPENMRAHFRYVEEGYTGLGDYLERVYRARYRGVEVHDKDKHNEYTWVSGPFVHLKPCEAMAAFLKKIYDKFVIGDNSDLVCTYDPEKVKFYQDNSKLVKMTVKDGIKAIVDASFYGCTGLKSVDLPDSLQTIGENAFRGCTLIKSIKIPKSVTSIGERAFSGCTKLESITIPPDVESIKRGAFEECIKLKSITIPDSIEFIEPYAFEGIDPSATINGIPYLEWLKEFNDKH